MKQYLDLLKDIMENGNDRMDRTGVGTRSVFGRQIRFKMDDGFPAVTTKKLAWKAVVSELLFFLFASSNTRRLAEIKNDNKPYNQLNEKERFTIWNANYEHQGKSLGYENGYLGGIYGVQWRKQYTIDFHTCEIVDNYNYIETYKKEKFAKKDVILNDSHCGETYETKCGKLIILKKLFPKDNYSGHIYYEVQFEETNYCCEARYDAIKKGNVKDPYKETVFGVGYFGQGVYYDSKSKIYERIKNIWNHMLSRCYNKLDKNYINYGGRGVKVCNRWHNFSNFCEDFEFILGFKDWMNNKDYELDKDMFGSDTYSLETCMFLPKKYNSRLSIRNVFEYNDKLYIGLKNLSDETGLSYDGLQKHFYQKSNKKYIQVKRAVIPEGKHVRYKLKLCDQVQQVIDKIRTNPNDRRLIVSAWNPCELDKMALPPCHMMYQFYVNDDKLSLMWYQRSVDSATGLPFNIASYALLLCIVAKMTNKIPNELIGTLGDTHIYKNHFEGVQEQLKRTPHKLPTLEMPDIDWSGSIDDVLRQVKTSDFRLINYVHDDPIKYEMAV